MSITAVFEKGAVVVDAETFRKETTGPEKTELSTGAAQINLASCKHRPILKDKTSSASCIYLPYAPGAINYVVPAGAAVLSSQFSGCWFVKYKLDGEVRVAHVGTPQCNELWAEMKTRTGFELHCEFKPTDIVDTKSQFSMLKKHGSGGGLTIGLITADDKCYAGFGAYALDTKTGQSPYTSLMWKKIG